MVLFIYMYLVCSCGASGFKDFQSNLHRLLTLSAEKLPSTLRVWTTNPPLSTSQQVTDIDIACEILAWAQHQQKLTESKEDGELSGKPLLFHFLCIFIGLLIYTVYIIIYHIEKISKLVLNMFMVKFALVSPTLPMFTPHF